MDFHPTSDYSLHHQDDDDVIYDEENDFNVCERISQLIDKRVELEEKNSLYNEKELQNIETELHELGWY